MGIWILSTSLYSAEENIQHGVNRLFRIGYPVAAQVHLHVQTGQHRQKRARGDGGIHPAEDPLPYSRLNGFRELGGVYDEEGRQLRVDPVPAAGDLASDHLEEIERFTAQSDAGLGDGFDLPVRVIPGVHRRECSWTREELRSRRA